MASSDDTATENPELEVQQAAARERVRTFVVDAAGAYADLGLDAGRRMLTGSYGTKALTRDAANLWVQWLGTVAKGTQLAIDCARLYAPTPPAGADTTST